MVKKTIRQKNILVGALVFLISILVLSVVLKNNNIDDGSFDSKYLQFSVNLPNGFQATDETSRIVINSDDGQVTVTRNGTQYNDLESYMLDYDSKRKLISTDENSIIIDGYRALSRLVEFPDQNAKQKSYYVYIDNWVYIFSTSSEELYDDLDEIAHSFRYTGSN